MELNAFVVPYDINLHNASEMIKYFWVTKHNNLSRRSGCPLNASIEMLGDRWSLLIIRDMMLRCASTYKEFMDSHEGIATNILADRLRRLTEYGIIGSETDPLDRRKVTYRLTKKGIDLAPVLTEMVLWAAAHEETGNQELVDLMRRDKVNFLEQIRDRWAKQVEGLGHVAGKPRSSIG